MKNKEMKKVLVNGALASAICVSMVGCDSANALIEEKETTSVTVSTTQTTKEEETIITDDVEKQPEMTMEELIILNERFKEYLENQSKLMETDIDVSFEKKIPDESTLTYLYLLNYPCFSEDEKEKLILNGLVSDNNEDIETNLLNVVSYIGYYNGSYSRFCNLVDKKAIAENYISLNDFVFDKNYEQKILNIDKTIYEYSFSDPNALGYFLVKDGILSGYELDDETITDLVIKQTYDYAVFMQIGNDLDENEKSVCIGILNGDLEKTNNGLFTKQKELVKE